MTLPSLGRRRMPAALAALVTVILVPGLTQLPTAVAEPLPGDPLGVGGIELPLLDGGDPVGTLADPVGGMANVDARGVAKPTATQLTASRRLGATLRWNSYGTPASILPASGPLARDSRAPATAARAWLVRNAALFGLTGAQMQGLDLVNDQRMAGSNGHAVLFRQRFGDLTPAIGSMVTVGVANGKVEYVSSSLTRTPADVQVDAATLDPLEGWVEAATSVGLELPSGAVGDIVSKVDQAADGWTRLTVPGLAQQQQARLRALAFADGSVRPVIEANVVQVAGGSSAAYTVMVDAVTGDTLHRENKVENVNDVQSFSGATTDTECGPEHTFTTTDGNTRTIALGAAAANTLNDIVVKLYRGNTLVASGDTATSPETVTYSPGTTIPDNTTFTAQVCPFDDPTAPLLPPYDYALSVVLSDQESGTPATPAYNPRWRFFTANPTLDSPSQTPTNSTIGCWLKGTGCTLPSGPLDNVFSFGPWDTTVATGMTTGTTSGNNAQTREAWLSPLTPGGTAQAPVSATGEYTKQFTDSWNNTRCNPVGAFGPGTNDIEASVTNLFATHNRMHDFAYPLGFTEANYNLQVDNVGRGGRDGDPEVGNAQAGAATGGQPSYLGRDNANQIALQDGLPGITNQYLFQPIAGAFYAPCTDGGLDMGIVGHEYTHAISNRMVGGPDEGLTSEHGGAMGESWSDQVAAEYQFAHGYSNGGNIWAVGVYATGNKSRAIRDYAINRNPLNFSNYGFDTTGPEVHADGEIWNGVAWEVRQALVRKWNSRYPVTNKKIQLQCAEAGSPQGIRKVQQCPGNRRWIAIMFDAFLLQQGATSMLDARDAYLAADRMRFGGANQKALWDAFARRGMGVNAQTPNADAENVTGSWVSRRSPNTRVTFRTSVPGRVYIGDFEARTTPAADTIGSTPRTNASSFTPGTYQGLFVSERNGAKRFRFTVTGERSRTITVASTTNLAAKGAGARVIASAPGSITPDALIDGTESTSWAGVSPTGVPVSTSKPTVAVDLAGGVSTIRTVNVSAMLNPATEANPDAGSRFTALRRFALEACVSRCGSSSATWRRFFTSSPDAFPAVRPRPTGPNLNLRTFKVPETRAAALRLVVLQNQCTGFAGYLGEQDDDPTNSTDCKLDSDRDEFVNVAELQAFSSSFTNPYNGDSRGEFTPLR